MSYSEGIVNHYKQKNLVGKILAGIEQLGKTYDTVAVEDLAPVDEFHIGGRIATKFFLEKLLIGKNEYVLDVGCGIGGTSRFVAHTYGCRVAGVDLTKEFVETGTTLSQWLGLKPKVILTQGNVLELEFADATFDKALMLHVGMNIADKFKLMKEIGRVLKPGGLFGIYDILRIGQGEVDYPVPWASNAKSSSVSSLEIYRRALVEAGFKVVSEVNRGAFALGFFEQVKAASAKSNTPPPLGLHLLMGLDARTKYENMIQGVAKGTIAPYELVAQKAKSNSL